MANQLINSIHRLKQRAKGLFNKGAISVAASFFAKVTGTVLGLILNLLLARLLGTAGIGVYFLVQTIVSIGATLSRLGLDMATLRFAAIAYSQKDRASLAGLYRQSIGLVGLAGATITCLIWLIGPYLPLAGERSEDFLSTLPYMLLGLLPAALIQLQGQFFKACGFPGLATFMQTALLPLFMVIAVSVLYWMGSASLQDIAISYAASSGLVMIGIGITWSRHNPGLLHNPGSYDTRLLLRTSLPLLWVASMAMVLNWTDILVLGVWTEPEAVGIYGIATRVAALTMFVLIAVNSVTAPRFAALHAKGDTDALQRLAQRSTSWMLLGVMPIVAALLIFPEFILQFFGEKFTDGALILRILVLGQFINVAVGSVGSLLIMCGHEKVVRNNIVFAIVINLAGNLSLVPIFGAIGAALSTAVSLSIQNLILYIKVRKILKINTLVFLP